MNKTKTLSWILLILMPVITVYFYVIISTRLVCAFLYNLTDFVQYQKWMFQETKDTFDELITIPTQVVDVVKMLWRKTR